MNPGKKQNGTCFCFSSNSLLGGGEGGFEGGAEGGDNKRRLVLPLLIYCKNFLKNSSKVTIFFLI